MNDDVILDCKNCKYDYACRTLVRAPIREDDKSAYPYDIDESFSRSGLSVLKRIDGHCVYFDPDKKCCVIWDNRPNVCRGFDCNQDPRIPNMVEQERQKKKVEKQSSGRKRVIVSIAIIDEEEKVKKTPMLIHNKKGSIAADMFEIISETDKISETVPNMIREIVKSKRDQK
jgi:Fe-S-cluster containining protein